MVEKTADGDLAEPGEKKGGPSALVTIIIILGLSVAAVGIGYVLGGVLRSNLLEPTGKELAKKASVQKKENSKDDAGKDGKAAKDDKDKKKAELGATFKLDPIIVTLPKSENTWLRLELALTVSGGASIPGDAQQARILADVGRFLRSAEVSQLYGPSGYLHLQEDLLDIARRATKGTIEDVLILSMVAE